MVRDRGLCLIAVLAIAGCGGKKEVRKPSLEAEARKIRDVNIRGNKKISDATLIGGLATRPAKTISMPCVGLAWCDPREARIYRQARVFDPIEFQRDLRRIASYYKQRGFFRAKIVSHRVRNVGTKYVDVDIEVFEGKLTRIRDVIVSGAPGTNGVTNQSLSAITGLKPGKPLVYAEYQRAKRLIRGQVVQKGYAFARVTGQVRVDRRIALGDIDIRVDPGPRARFGKTEIKGAGKIPLRSIEARIAWKEGESFSSSKLRKSQSELYELGVFSTVNMEYAKQQRPEVADITVRLREAARHEIKLGGGGGLDRSRYEIRGRAVYSEKGFYMPLLTLRLEARPSYSFLRDPEADPELLGVGFEASASLTKQDFLAPLWQGSASITTAARDFTAYSIQGSRLVLAITRRLFADRLRLGFAWNFRLQRVASEVIPELEHDELGIKSPYRVGFFQQSIAYDGRDSPITPRRGIYADLRLEEAGTYAGSDFAYIRVLPELRIYRPLGERIVLAGRARYGRTLSGDVLPITERFFAGGASSQRGFALQRLSPRIGGQLDDAPIGGRAMVETTAEARIDVIKLGGSYLGVAGFVDGGEATREPDDLKLSNLHWAAGAGLRYHTLIGPVRVDIAWRLNRKGPGNLDALETWAWHFSLGEAF